MIEITPAAVAAFRRLQAATDETEWWQAHRVLHAALGLRPWQWPAIERPNTVCDDLPGTGAHDWFFQAQALYRALETAAGSADPRPHRDDAP